MADRQKSSIRGFASSLWTFRRAVFWQWDFVISILVVVLGFILLPDAVVERRSEALATAGVGLGGAMVGVVVAGLAVVVALLDDELLALMDIDDESGRVPGHLFPFWFVAGIGVATFLLSALLFIVPGLLPPLAHRVLYVAVAGLLVWTALGVFNLVGSMQALGINRALLARGRRR